jgi:hypothetical protein
VDAVLAVATIIGGIAAIWFFSDKIASIFALPGVKERDVSDFVREGQELRARSGEDPLPIQAHNDWVARMTAYFRNHKGRGYEVRLNDFSGMPFYGDGSERAKFEDSIDGRIRRLHEFLGEL